MCLKQSGAQEEQSYWDIRKHLPKETQGYVPAFLATMYLYEYHNEHGIKADRAVVQHFATDTIMIKKQMSTRLRTLDVPNNNYNYKSVNIEDYNSFYL
jgi:membrane-bound lytic murein transglycosylase D